MLGMRVMKGLQMASAVRPSLVRLCSASANNYSFETLQVTTPRENVYHVMINRADKLNSMNKAFWTEIGECFKKLGDDSDCRAVVLSGAGRLFTSGLDFNELSQMAGFITGDDDIARKCRQMLAFITQFQECFTALEKCPKPVIAAVHSACIGGGVDLVCAADMRYCTSDAWFQVKEVDIGLAADIGTLQRLPKIIGNQSLVRELAFSARKMFSDEAFSSGLVSRVFPDKESLVTGALDMAELIASKSPVAVQNTKVVLIHSRDHSVQETLSYQAMMNSAMLQSEDLMKAAMAMMNKEKATFSKL